MTDRFKQLANDPLSKVGKFLKIMRDLSLLTDTERYLAVNNRYGYQYQNVNSLFIEACKEVSSPNDISYLEDLIRVYNEKYKFGKRYQQPYFSDVEEFVEYNL